MRTIEELLQLAKDNIGTKSDRELARQLGLTTVSTYRKKNVIPDDMTAFKLADLCGLPAHEVLITCHLLKAAAGEHPETHGIWKDVLKMVPNACIVLAALGFLTLNPTTATAKETPQKWGYCSLSTLTKYPLCDVVIFCIVAITYLSILRG